MKNKFENIAEMAYKDAVQHLDAMKKGEKKMLGFSDNVNLREMIGTDSGAQEFLEVVMLEAYQEIEKPENETLYTPFYDVVVDSTLPLHITIDEMGPYGIVFLQTLEGEEIKFGTLEPGSEKTITSQTFTSGMEYTEDMVEYNQYFRITDMARQMGRAYNARLNYSAFYPLLSGTFVTTAGGLQTQRDYQYGVNGQTATAQLVAYDTSIAQTLLNAISIFPNGYYIVCNSIDAIVIEEAIAGALLPDDTPNRVKRTLRPENIIVWDGYSVQVGAKLYNYAGVTSGECYLVSRAKSNFRMLFKHTLRITQGDGDLSRLIMEQIVARYRLALFAALAGPNGAVKVELE